MIFIAALIISLFSIFLYFILFNNIILANRLYTCTTIQLYTLSIFYLIITILHSIRVSNNKIANNVITLYLNFLKTLSSIVIFQHILIIISFILLLLEVNFILFIKVFVFLSIIGLMESMLFFLISVFYRYRWLMIIAYGGTILLAPLITEAMNFLREPWMRSVLMFWNWVVPFQVISGMQNVLLAEGWQQMDLLAINAAYVLIYCFIVASVCLYLRQLQTQWTPSSLPGRR